MTFTFIIVTETVFFACKSRAHNKYDGIIDLEGMFTTNSAKQHAGRKNMSSSLVFKSLFIDSHDTHNKLPQDTNPGDSITLDTLLHA